MNDKLNNGWYDALRAQEVWIDSNVITTIEAHDRDYVRM